MSFLDDIGGAISDVASAASHVISDVGELAGSALNLVEKASPLLSIAGCFFPPLGVGMSVANLVSGAVGDAVLGAAKQLVQESGMPKFLLGDIGSLISDVLKGLQQPSDAQCDHACGQDFGSQISDFSDALAKSIADIAKQVLELGGDEEGTGKTGKSGGGGGAKNWLVAIAEAMGKAAGQHASKMVDLSHEIANAGGSDGKAAEAATAKNAEFSAEAQLFGMLQNAFSNAIKSIGEGMSAMARK